MASKVSTPSQLSTASTIPEHKANGQQTPTDLEEKLPPAASTTGDHASPVAPGNEVIEEGKYESSTPNEHADDDGEVDEDESRYPKAWKLAVILLALALAIFCMALDNTIIATAIPKITDQFHALDDVSWYASAYLLTICSFQLFFGRLYTFFNIKWVFLTAVTIFELGSLVCATAPSSIALIIGRAIAGLGASGIFSGAILIIANIAPLEKRPIYTGIFGGMYGVASVAGPLLGGVFTTKLTWRWCFYINLPLGGVTLGFIALFFKGIVPIDARTLTWKQKVAKLDYIGTFFFIPGIVCLLLALQWGGTKYPWDNGRIIALFILFGILIAAFIGVQKWKQDLGTVPPRILLQRTVGAAAWFAMSLGGAFFVLIYYVPIWFQAIKGVTAEHSGIDSVPLLLGVTLFSLISGIGTTVLGYYTPWVIASSVLMSIGSGLLTTLKVHTPSSHWIPFQAIAGFGIGMGIQNPLIAVQTVLPLKDIPTGTAVIVFSQTLGGAIFVSVGQNIFLNKLLTNLKAEVPEFPAQIVLTAGATTLKQHVPAQFLPRVLIAYNKAITQTFYVSVALAAVSVVGAFAMEWRSVKGKKLDAMAAGG